MQLSLLRVPDQKSAVAELVKEHRVMQLDWIALTPEGRQALDDRVEIRLGKRLRFHAAMLACPAVYGS